MSLYANLIGFEVDFDTDTIDVKLVSSIVCQGRGYGLVLIWVIE